MIGECRAFSCTMACRPAAERRQRQQRLQNQAFARHVLPRRRQLPLQIVMMIAWKEDHTRSDTRKDRACGCAVDSVLLFFDTNVCI